MLLSASFTWLIADICVHYSGTVKKGLENLLSGFCDDLTTKFSTYTVSNTFQIYIQTIAITCFGQKVKKTNRLSVYKLSLLWSCLLD